MVSDIHQTEKSFHQILWYSHPCLRLHSEIKQTLILIFLRFQLRRILYEKKKPNDYLDIHIEIPKIGYSFIFFLLNEVWLNFVLNYLPAMNYFNLIVVDNKKWIISVHVYNGSGNNSKNYIACTLLNMILRRLLKFC